METLNVLIEHLLPASIGAWVWIVVWAAISFLLYELAIAGGVDAPRPLPHQIPGVCVVVALGGSVFILIMCAMLVSLFEWPGPFMFTPILVHAVMGTWLATAAWLEYR